MLIVQGERFDAYAYPDSIVDVSRLSTCWIRQKDMDIDGVVSFLTGDISVKKIFTSWMITDMISS